MMELNYKISIPKMQNNMIYIKIAYRSFKPDSLLFKGILI